MKRGFPQPARAVEVATRDLEPVTSTLGNRFAPLSPDEQSIILDLMVGRSLKEISADRGRYPQWASHKVQDCMARLGARSQAELIGKLIALGEIRVRTL